MHCVWINAQATSSLSSGSEEPFGFFRFTLRTSEVPSAHTHTVSNTSSWPRSLHHPYHRAQHIPPPHRPISPCLFLLFQTKYPSTKLCFPQSRLKLASCVKLSPSISFPRMNILSLPAEETRKHGFGHFSTFPLLQAAPPPCPSSLWSSQDPYAALPPLCCYSYHLLQSHPPFLAREIVPKTYASWSSFNI